MSKLAVWSSSCFSTLVQVSWPGPCCAVLPGAGILLLYSKFEVFLPAARLQHGDTDNTPRNSFIHKKILFPSCRYTTGTGSEEWGWTTGGKKLARHLLVQILRKELWPANWAQRGKKDMTAKQLVYSEIEISSFQTLIWDILVPKNDIAHCAMVTITTYPSPCFTFQQQLYLCLWIWPRSCYEWCPPH